MHRFDIHKNNCMSVNALANTFGTDTHRIWQMCVCIIDSILKYFPA